MWSRVATELHDRELRAVRIDDPDERVAIVFTPAIGEPNAIDDGNRTVHIASHDPSVSGTAPMVTSDCVEYFAPSGSRDSCVPAGAVVATKMSSPADRLLTYAANAIERTTSAGSERATLVIECGNLHAAARLGRAAARAARRG